MRKETGGGVGIAVAIVGLLLLLPAIYVLSIGPAVRLIHMGWLNESAAEVVYTPLIALTEICSPGPVEDGLTVYVEWWEPPSSVLAVPAIAPLPPLPPPSYVPPPP